MKSRRAIQDIQCTYTTAVYSKACSCSLNSQHVVIVNISLHVTNKHFRQKNNTTSYVAKWYKVKHC